MLKIGEKSAGALLAESKPESPVVCMKVYIHQSQEIMQQKLSDELVILFLEDDCHRYYYIPSYDFAIIAADGEYLGLKKIALPVLSHIKGFKQGYDNKTKKNCYSPDTTEQVIMCLNQRIQTLLDQAKKKKANFENWKTIECQLLESLKRNPITASR